MVFMESQFLINSIGLGGLFFVGVIVLWFVFVYLKKRITPSKPHPSIATAFNIPVENKRQHTRVDVSWEARLENSDKSLEVILNDISLGGAFVICQEPLAMQDQIKIIINRPTAAEALSLNAEVVWTNANMPLDRVVNRGMGIKFINNEPKERQQLQDAIDAAFEKSDKSV
jgi:Tfp pilus assembly protein PilZ